MGKSTLVVARREGASSSTLLSTERVFRPFGRGTPGGSLLTSSAEVRGERKSRRGGVAKKGGAGRWLDNRAVAVRGDMLYSPSPGSTRSPLASASRGRNAMGGAPGSGRGAACDRTAADRGGPGPGPRGAVRHTGARSGAGAGGAADSADPRPATAALGGGCRRAFICVGFITSMASPLHRTGAFCMQQICNRVVPSRRVPMLVALAFMFFTFQGILDLLRKHALTRILSRRAPEPPHLSACRKAALAHPRAGDVQPVRHLESVRGVLSGLGPSASLELLWLTMQKHHRKFNWRTDNGA
jgi:hypothetical protein